MTANINIAGAAPTQLKWSDLEWSGHKAVVKKLQVRIAKAVKENRWGKVKSLQRLLTASFSAKVLAVRKVTQNQGKNTPGVDGKILRSNREKAEVVTKLNRRDYQPKPLRRVYIKKKNGKMRPLSIPTIFDRAMQQLYYSALSPISETVADTNSYGFRPERSCADAIAQTFNVLGRQDAAQWIMEGDIKGCFDNISHRWMMDNICMNKTILHKWLKAGYVETKKLFPTNSGTPQGGIISPCLSNFVLDGMDQLLDKNFGERRYGINLIRYADDFIITAKTREPLELVIKPLIIGFLKERGLELSEDKTKITHIYDGFDFLGQNIRKYPAGKNRMKILIKPSKDNVKTFLAKIRGTVKNSGSMTQIDLIKTLNSKIKGWVNYHRSVVSKQIFSKVDHEIWQTIWKWAKRRHPKKSSGWLMKTYYPQQGLRNYIFSATERLSNGTKVQRSLLLAADTPIIRHIKIRKEANIFDPYFDEYYEARKSQMMRNSNTGIAATATLLKKQLYKCVCCGENLYSWYQWTIHLINSKLKGGDYRTGNLCIVHTQCHRKGFKEGFVYKLPVVSNRSG